MCSEHRYSNFLLKIFLNMYRSRKSTHCWITSLLWLPTKFYCLATTTHSFYVPLFFFKLAFLWSINCRLLRNITLIFLSSGLSDDIQNIIPLHSSSDSHSQASKPVSRFIFLRENRVKATDQANAPDKHVKSLILLS